MGPEDAVDQEVPVMTELLQEARRYQTMETVLQWPVVTNTADSLLDAYSALKEGDVARVVLNASEELAGVYFRFVVLPIVQTPFVRTPLKLVDYATSTGVRLVEKAVPQLKDEDHPMKLNGDLLWSLLFLPLTISVVLGHEVLEGAASQLVSVFPQLHKAAKGFEQKSLLGQWVTLVLMTTLYLPLQLLSHPAQTVRQLSAVPLRTAAAMADWVSDMVRLAMAEMAVWANWVSFTARNLAIRALAMAGAMLETVYYVVFEATGLRKQLQSVLDWVSDVLRWLQDGVRQLLSSAAETAPVKGLVRRMWTLSPALSWRLFGASGSCGAAPSGRRAPASAAPAPTAADSRSWRRWLGRPTVGRPEKPETREADLWAPSHIGLALLLTLGPVLLAAAFISLQ